MKIKVFYMLSLLLFLIAGSATSLNAREAGDFSDLFEGEKKYYGSEKEEKFSINAFLVEREKWEDHNALMVFFLFKKTDYPRYRSLRILPFYYGLQSKIDNRKRLCLPLLTFYNRLDGSDELTVSLPYYSHLKKGSRVRSLFYLFWWGSQSHHDSDLTRWGATPVAFWYRHENSRHNVMERLQGNPLYVYSSSRGKKRDRYTFWAPVIPLTWHHRSLHGGHRNFFWLIDYSWQTIDGHDRMKRFWLAPLFFWKDRSYFHLLPPLYISLKETGLTRQGKHHYTRTRAIVTPLFVSWHRNARRDGRHLESFFWFPLLPLFYHSNEGRDGSHTNVLWFLDWSRGDDGSLKRFWLAPLYFGRDGVSGYRHLLPPLYLSGYDRSGSYRHLLPVFLSGKSERGGYFHLLPLLHFTWKQKGVYMAGSERNLMAEKKRHLGIAGGWFQTDVVSPEKSGTDEDTFLLARTIWFPLLPLFYSSYKRFGGNHVNLLWLFDWKKGPSGEMERFWFMPLVFHDFSPGGYRFYAPFYFNPGSDHEKRGLSFGVFHYHRWSENREITWAWPWYSWRHFRTKHYYRHALPVYFSWRLKGSRGRLVFPFYLSYETKRRSLTVNLLGLSRSVATGPFAPSLGVGKYKGRWYLDTDFSWFYDLASISMRVTVSAPKGDAVEEKPLEEGGTPSTGTEGKKPLLSKKRTFDREHSHNFFGFKLLFGWLAWERGDTRRHFRLLPLSWFTWDTASDDRIYVAPPFFLWYKSVEERVEYFVLFPFYGSQREKDSWMRAWCLNLYWDEYDAKEKRHERDILWPLVNWYHSPNRSGWRVFPLVWHKKKLEEKGRHERYISPLFYSCAVFRLNGKKEETLYRHIINPLFYLRSEKHETKSYSHLAVPLLPLFYHGTREAHYRYRVLPPRSEREAGAAAKIDEYSDRYTKHFLFPFYFYAGMERASGEASPDIERSLLLGLPLLYYSSYAHRDSGGSYSRTRRLFLLGYHWYAKPRYRKHSFLLGLYKYENYSRNDRSVHSLFWGLMKVTSSGKGGAYSRFFPLYSYRSANDEGRLWLLLGLGGVYSWYGHGDRSFYSLWGLFHLGSYGETKSIYSGGRFERVPVAVSRSWFFPLYYHRSVSGDKGGSLFSRTLHWNPLMVYATEKRTSKNSRSRYTRFWFPLVPVFYRYSSDSEAHWNFLGIIDNAWSRKGHRRRSYFLPFYYYNRGSSGRQVNICGLFDSTWRRKDDFHRLMLFPFFARYHLRGNEKHLFLPLLFSYHGRGSNWSTTVIAGTYWHRESHYSRQNLWLMYDHRHYVKDNLDSFRLFLGTVRVDVSPEVRRWRLFYGMLARYENFVNQPKYSFDVLYILAHARRDGNHFSHSLQPLWYYSRDGEEWRFWSIAGLTYLHHDDEGAFDLGLLGLAYYRNEKIDEGRDRRMVLLGTLWHEVKRPVRRYHSRGMFWGLLWNYETEEETGFKKLSILKGLYKRTEIKGKVRHKVLWVF